MNSKRRQKLKAMAKPRRWQLQEAKAKFSQVFELALHSGPQRVSRREKDAVVIVRESEFNELAHPRKRPTVIEALLEASKLGGFKIPRKIEYPKAPEGFE